METATIVQDAPRYVGRKVTREMYLDLEDDGFKYDMVDGVLQLAPSGFSEHAETQSEVAAELVNRRGKKRAFRVFTELDVLLPDGGDVVRPDVCVVMKERADIIFKHIHGAPDLVVEILSDSTAEKDLGQKAERYRKCGVKEYWLLDPRNRTMQVWNNRGEKWARRTGVELKSELLDGFLVKADNIFPTS